VLFEIIPVQHKNVELFRCSKLIGILNDELYAYFPSGITI
jgi:hypothetical protein